MTQAASNRQAGLKKYLDDVQDEAFLRSSLHGDAAIEQEYRLPAIRVNATQLFDEVPSAANKEDRLSLSGTWRMRDCDPADPGSPAPSTGWFGRKAKGSPGMEERWHALGYDRSSWHEVTVPGTVQKSLIELGLLEDPHWSTNTIDELESHGDQELPTWFRRTRVECRDWWFAKTFRIPSEWKDRRLVIRFDGIDYSGTVFFNGESLGHHAGMFGGPELDVTGLAVFDGENELVVRIDQAPESWNGIMKGSPSFGWHYGHLISLGIWKDVWLTAEHELSITDPFVVTKSIEDGKAILDIEYALIGLHSDRHKVKIEGEIIGLGDAGASKPMRFLNEVEAGYGRSTFRTEVEVQNPALWWPLGYGDPSLYRLKLTVRISGSDDISDGTEVSFGVRTIWMDALEGAEEEKDYRWQFVVNGVPMFVKGANWCWPDPLLEQEEAKYERLLELARRGNVQMLRAWGGGVIEPDFFYRMCDEKGIMVYQEFPLCWGPMDAPYTDLGVLDRQTTRTVKRLRNHPSIVMWGGGNENGPHGGADEGLFLVGRRCRGFDPSRPFHRTDPWGGSVHNWHVYHGGEPLDEATYAMPSVFYGEFGIPSMTNLSSVPRYLPESALTEWPPTEESRGWLAHFHQFSLKDPIKVMRYGSYGPIRDWETYALYSQTAQGESIRLTGEMQRAGSGVDKAGFWYYKFTDLFPGHSWAVVDYYGTPKLSYYRAMQVCRPRSAFAVCAKTEGWKAGDKFRASLHAANDTLDHLDGISLVANLYGSRLTVLHSKSCEGFALVPNMTLSLGELEVELPEGNEELSPFLMSVTMRDPKGTLLSDQWYWFNAQPKNEELLSFERAHTHNDNEYPGELANEAFGLYANLSEAPLRSLPSTQLEWTLEWTGEAGLITVRNSGDLPAVRVTIENFPDEWDCFLEDNDFGLHPHEVRVIRFEAGNNSDLEGLKLQAWNAPSCGVTIDFHERGEEQ